MNEKEVLKCPGCGGDMIHAYSISAGVNLVYFREKPLSLKPYTGRIIPHVCQKCGYVELYDEKKLKEGVEP